MSLSKFMQMCNAEIIEATTQAIARIKERAQEYPGVEFDGMEAVWVRVVDFQRTIDKEKDNCTANLTVPLGSIKFKATEMLEMLNES